jgi:hypothetical protein
MAEGSREFLAQEIREECGRVCYEIWVESTLLCIVWIPARQSKTHGEKFLTEWCRRHEGSLKNAGIVGIDFEHGNLVRLTFDPRLTWAGPVGTRRCPALSAKSRYVALPEITWVPKPVPLCVSQELPGKSLMSFQLMAATQSPSSLE